MGGCDGGDHQRIDGRQERVEIRDSLHIQIGGHRGSERRVDVVQHNGGNVGVGCQPFGVRSTNAADPGDAHAHIRESVPQEATCRGAQVDWVDGTQGTGGMARPGALAALGKAAQSTWTLAGSGTNWLARQTGPIPLRAIGPHATAIC